MERFLAKHRDATTGTLSCFDRLLIKGHLPLDYPRAMEEFLDRHGVLFKQLKPFVLRQAERLKLHARAVAAQAGRPWAIAARDGVTEGLVCVFGTIEPCRSFRLAYQHGRPARRKCLFLYLWLEDPARVQRLADRFAILKWPARLDTLACRVNPLLGDLLASYRYYWATNQAEYATDVFFKSRPGLRDLYPRLLRHATLCLSAEDVLTFLGRKLHGRFTGEVLNEWKRRWRGARQALDEGELDQDVR
jgi:hypothetical protein